MYCTNDDCPELAIDCPGHDENNLGIIASTLSAASLAHSSSSPSPDLVVASSLHPLSLLPSSPLSNLTAVVLLPPRDLWEPIQSIRRLLDKKHVDRWPPHVTLFYPFYPPGLLEQATELLRYIYTHSDKHTHTHKHAHTHTCRHRHAPVRSFIHMLIGQCDNAFRDDHQARGWLYRRFFRQSFVIWEFLTE
jgi:hypothetical protein